MADDDPGYFSGDDDLDDEEAFWDSFQEECSDAASHPNCSSNGPE